MSDDVFIGVAEIAVTLAGFTGVVITFQNDPSKWPEVDRLRVWTISYLSLSSIPLALLPIALSAAQVPTPLLWRISSGAILIIGIVLQPLFWHPYWRIREHWPIRPVAAILMVTGLLGVACAQIANVFAIFPNVASSLYLCGLAWSLFHAGIVFAEIIFIRPTR